MSPTQDLDSSGQYEISRQLEPGESLLRKGKPRQGLLFRQSDALLIPFSLMWAGFAMFWEWGEVSSGAPNFMALWGIPFVLMGLYVVVGRFFADSIARSKTYYGLTDRRVIILSGLFARTTNSLPLRTLSGVSVQERADGSGIVLFGPPNPYAGWMGGSGWPGSNRYQPPCFDLIPDAKRVHDRVLEAQRKAV